MYNINDILEFLGFKYKIEDCSIRLHSSYSHKTGVDYPKYTYYFKEHGYPRPQVEGLFVSTFKRLQDVGYEPVNNKYRSIDNEMGLRITEDKILLYRLLDDNEPETKEHDIEQSVLFRIVPSDKYKELIPYSLCIDVSEVKPDPEEELTEEFFNIQERIERGNEMEKYEIPDTGIRSFRLRNKICEAKIDCEDKLTIYNLHPEDKWALCEFKAFIYKALRDFNYNDNCIDKYLQSVNDKISIVDLSSNKDDILLRYGDKNVPYVFKMDEHRYFTFERLPWNYKEFNIKEIVSIMDYLTREYELEDLQSEVIPIPREICNITSLDQLTVIETKSEECTNTPMVCQNINRDNIVKDIIYKSTGVILDDFYLLQVDELEECNNAYKSRNSNQITIDNYNDYTNQFYIDLLDKDKDFFTTDPDLIVDRLDIIVRNKSNIKDSSPVRYIFKLK